MLRRQFLTGCACCGLLARTPTLFAAAPGPLPARLERPEPGSDEGGLWSLLSREEERLKRSSCCATPLSMPTWPGSPAVWPASIAQTSACT